MAKVGIVYLNSVRPHAVTRYVYDGDGVLVQKVSGDQTTHDVNGGYEVLKVGSL